MWPFALLKRQGDTVVHVNVIHQVEVDPNGVPIRTVENKVTSTEFNANRPSPEPEPTPIRASRPPSSPSPTSPKPEQKVNEQPQQTSSRPPLPSQKPSASPKAVKDPALTPEQASRPISSSIKPVKTLEPAPPASLPTATRESSSGNATASNGSSTQQSASDTSTMQATSSRPASSSSVVSSSTSRLTVGSTGDLDVTASQTSQQKSNSNNSPPIAIIIGCIVAALIFFTLLFWFVRRRANKKKKQTIARRSFAGTEASFWNSDDAKSPIDKISFHSGLQDHSSAFSGSHSSMISKTQYTAPPSRYSAAQSDHQEIMSEVGARTSFFGHNDATTIIPVLPYERPASEISLSRPRTFRRPPTAFSVISNNLTSISRNKKLPRPVPTNELDDRSIARPISNAAPSHASLGYDGMSAASLPGQLVTSTFIGRARGSDNGL